MLNRDFGIVICDMWFVNCDLVIWTQPSGPLCLWQCLYSVFCETALATLRPFSYLCIFHLSDKTKIKQYEQNKFWDKQTKQTPEKKILWKGKWWLAQSSENCENLSKSWNRYQFFSVIDNCEICLLCNCSADWKIMSRADITIETLNAGGNFANVDVDLLQWDAVIFAFLAGWGDMVEHFVLYSWYFHQFESSPGLP